jgi:DNA-binding transcriptional MerR regulator
VMVDPVEREAAAPSLGGGAGARDRAAQGRQPAGTMSIGEVLAVLKPEFPDITVSKIRFLESAGLIRPDRSASGYRKFSEDDVARLRFVLRAQRDQYLPLRVIRQRLADLESGGELRLQGGAPEADPPTARRAGAPAAPKAGTPLPAGWPPAAGSGTGSGDGGAGVPAPSGHVAGPGERPGPGWSPPRAGLLSSAPPSDAQFSRDELCRAAGTSADQLAELEAFGLIAARGATERGSWYGGDDLVVLRLARELANYGLEARHLRMYKTFAEREAALFEQVVAPLLRQRNPESRARAREMLDSLAELGSRMRDVALRTAIGSFAEGTERRR